MRFLNKKKFLSLPVYWKIIIPVTLLGLFYLLINKIFFSSTAEPQYKTSQVKKGNIIQSISVTGSITSGNNTNIYTGASGVVSAVYAKNGDTVKQGQKIAQIKLDQDGQKKQNTAWAAYLSAKNAVASAEQNKLTLENSLESSKLAFDQAQDALNKIDDFTKTDLQKEVIHTNYSTSKRSLTLAEQKYANADSAISIAKTQLSAAWYSYQQSSNIIYAPASGVLTNFALTEGMSVTNLSSTNSSSSNNDAATQSVGIIVNPDNQTTATVSLTEIDVTSVKPDQKVMLTMDAFPDKTFTGKVLAINTNGQAVSGVTSYPTMIIFDNSLSNMYPNMSVSADIIVDSKTDVLIVPTAAISNTDGVSTVKVIKDNQISQVSVEVGISDNSNSEIIAGLNEGDVVITSVNNSETKTNKSPAATQSVFGGNRFGGMGGGMRP
jgi:HlyD family secretion protein